MYTWKKFSYQNSFLPYEIQIEFEYILSLITIFGNIFESKNRNLQLGQESSHTDNDRQQTIHDYMG